MSINRILVLALLLTMNLIIQSSAWARGPAISFCGGSAHPAGKLEYYKTGYGLESQIEFISFSGFSFLLDLAYNRFDSDDQSLAEYIKKSISVGPINISASGYSYVIDIGIGFRPYLDLQRKNLDSFLTASILYSFLNERYKYFWFTYYGGGGWESGGRISTSRLALAGSGGVIIKVIKGLGVTFKIKAKYILTREQVTPILGMLVGLSVEY